MSASSSPIWIVASLSIVAWLIATLLYVLRKRRGPRPGTQLAPKPLVEVPVSRFVDFEPIAACHPSSWRLEDQPADWQSAMARIGERLRGARVAEVLFVHGTMTGHDPLAMGSVVKRALPALHRRVGRVIQRVAKAGSDRILGDLGNYAPEYVHLFEAALRRFAVHRSCGRRPIITSRACGRRLGSRFGWPRLQHRPIRKNIALAPCS